MRLALSRHGGTGHTQERWGSPMLIHRTKDRLFHFEEVLSSKVLRLDVSTYHLPRIPSVACQERVRVGDQ